MAHHPDLAAKLLDDPRDTQARLVYADFLQSKGDPRGELIMLQHAGKDAEAEAFIATHAEALLGPLRAYTRTWDHDPSPALDWYYGWIRSARVGYQTYVERKDIELPDRERQADAALRVLLVHPSAAFLESLTVNMNMLDDGMYFDPVLQVISELGAPALRTLHLGEFQQAGPGGVDNGYDYENSWAGFGNGSGMGAKLPRLESLRIQMNLGGASIQGGDEIGVFDLPKLKRLEVITGGMSQGCLHSFASGKLPAIESMELWTGSSNYGGDGRVVDLEPLLTGEHVPALTQLGIMNSELVDELIPVLARSKLLPRLKKLSLAHGMMSDAGAEALATHAAAFAHLAELDLSDNYLSAEGVERVRGVCEQVLLSQREADDYRYVALSE